MAVSKPLRWTLYVVGGLIASLLLIIIILAFIPITIDLSEYKGAVESAATLALGRTVKVDNKIVIATSLQPYFFLEGIYWPVIICILGVVLIISGIIRKNRNY